MRVVTGLLIGVMLTGTAAAQDTGGAAAPGGSSTPHGARDRMQGRGIRVLTAGESGSQPAAPPTPARPVAPAPAATAQTTAMTPPITLCTRPLDATDLRLGAEPGSGAQLATKLRQGRRVSVDLVMPYPLKSETPAPLGAWLSAVKASGGTVTVMPYCNEGSRGLFARLFGLFSSNDPGRAYRAAKFYDVVLHDDERAKTVTQLEFVPRGAVRSGGR